MDTVTTTSLPADAVVPVSPEIEAALAISREIFGEATAYESYDPEFAEDKYVVIAVNVTGDVATIVAKQQAWIARINQSIPRLFSVRLSLRPVE